jgi:hypothetical protein
MAGGRNDILAELQASLRSLSTPGRPLTSAMS